MIGPSPKYRPVPTREKARPKSVRRLSAQKAPQSQRFHALKGLSHQQLRQCEFYPLLQKAVTPPPARKTLTRDSARFTPQQVAKAHSSQISTQFVDRPIPNVPSCANPGKTLHQTCPSPFPQAPQSRRSHCQTGFSPCGPDQCTLGRPSPRFTARLPPASPRFTARPSPCFTARLPLASRPLPALSPLANPLPTDENAWWLQTAPPSPWRCERQPRLYPEEE